MHRATIHWHSLSSFARRPLAFSPTRSLAPTPPPPPRPCLCPCLCLSRASSSSSSSSSSSGNDESPIASPSRPSTPRRLLNHSSPLDLLTNLSSPSSGEDSSSKGGNPQASILDQLGVKLDTTNAAPSSSRRHNRHFQGKSRPTHHPRDHDPSKRNRNPPPLPPPRPSGDSDFDLSSSSPVSSYGVPPKANRNRSSPSSPSISPAQPTRSLDRWDPLKKLPRSTMDRLRFLHSQDPKTFSVAALSTAYGIGYESVKRILRSKFVPEPDRAKEMDARRAKLKDEWRAMRAREVREKLAREKADKEKEVEVEANKHNMNNNKDEEGGVDSALNKQSKGRSKSKGGVTTSADVEADDGWDWLAAEAVKPRPVGVADKPKKADGDSE